MHELAKNTFFVWKTRNDRVRQAATDRQANFPPRRLIQYMIATSGDTAASVISFEILSSYY